MGRGVRFALVVAGGLVFSCTDQTPEPGSVLVQSIKITGNNILDGKVVQLSSVVLPENAKNRGVNWSVTNPAVATISTGGLLKAVSNGTVIVHATAKDASGIVGEREFNISGVTTSGSPPLNLEGIIVSTASELTAAIANVSPGDSIYVHGGTYVLNSRINITLSGTTTEKIYLFPYPGDARPRLDFSSMTENSANQGIVLSGSYWHIKGIDVYHAGDNGLQIRGGSNNIIEFCTFSECADSGLQIDNGASNNLILNCDSYYNADATIENADGFACKLTAGTGNKFVGCRAWQNLDDGWDGYLRGADNITTTYENCWAYKNGYLKTGVVSGGDGNGFKTGGSDDKDLKHHGIFRNCIAAGNLFDGFDHNSNRGNIALYNCVAHANGTNMGFGATNPVASLIMKNCAVPGTVGGLNGAVVDISNNSWQDGLVCNNLDYSSIDMLQLIGPRKPNGDLPDITYLRLVSNSDLINRGVDVGLPYLSTAPDLGPFESNF